jgi:hypothetical protein
MVKRASLPLLLLLAACDPRPARFADAAAVTLVSDDRPIQLPRTFEPVREIRISEAYLRRPLVNALDPARVPVGGDVNALDEVPRSSWFVPGGEEPLADALDPPALPLHPLATPAESRDDALRVVDARGRFFEIFGDPPDRPEMATGAAAAASRILRALGYRTPGVFLRDLGEADFTLPEDEDRAAVRALFARGPSPASARRRMALVRWPVGIDLGPTHAFDRREKDPNDRVPHLDRRTLRALGVFFEWLGIGRLDGGVLRDAYVGAPGAGHVTHWVVDAGGAFGADAVVRATPVDDGDFTGQNPFVTMGTLGLYTPRVMPTQRRFLAIGEYGPRIGARPLRTSPPFEPMDRLLPADAYWAAKRMAGLDARTLEGALDEARISDPAARRRLGEIVAARRLALTARGFAAVSPLEVEAVEAGVVTLRDEAVLRGFAAGATTRYRAALIDDTGRTIAGPVEIAARGAQIAVALPAGAPAYAVLRVTAVHGGRDAPRAMEAHLVHRREGWALVGVRH